MNGGSKRTVVLAQVNFQYGRNVFIPYAVGSIQAFAETVREIREHFDFLPPLFRRDDIEKTVQEMGIPAVVGFSCYLWNWEYNKALAQAIRKVHPNALIVFGGTHVPDASEGFFLKHPYVDILVHHEGEFSFSEILKESLSDEPDYTKIPGLSVRAADNSTLKTPGRGRITEAELEQLPSPYLAGIFDFMLDGDWVLNASQETTRGCPYTCTFCDWGGSNYSKVHKFPESRIMAEFEWFGVHKVGYIFNCDANYGLFPSDIELTRKMIEIRSKHQGFPEKFRMCTAKKSSDRIFEIVKLLDAAGMNKGATLSFQSMDAHTLELVRRSNIKITEFSALMDRYKEAGIATYTELIMGMPGETYESSKKGIDVLFAEQADSVNAYVYPCTMLPNSQMSRPEYVKQHGIESVHMPILLAHSTPEPESFVEYADIAIGTSAMPKEDWLRTYLFYWAIQCFHCLGLLQQIAIFFHRECGLEYSDFYEKLIERFAGDSQTLVGTEIARTKEIVEEAMQGGRLDRVMPEYGEIYWPLEEASFLKFITDKDRFFGEVREFVQALSKELGFSEGTQLIGDLVAYQSWLMISPNATESVLEIWHDLPAYFKQIRNPAATLESKPIRLAVEDTDYSGDLERYAREVVWYGRKGGSFHHRNVSVEVL